MEASVLLRTVSSFMELLHAHTTEHRQYNNWTMLLSISNNLRGIESPVELASLLYRLALHHTLRTTVGFIYAKHNLLWRHLSVTYIMYDLGL